MTQTATASDDFPPIKLIAPRGSQDIKLLVSLENQSCNLLKWGKEDFGAVVKTKHARLRMVTDLCEQVLIGYVVYDVLDGCILITRIGLDESARVEGCPAASDIYNYLVRMYDETTVAASCELDEPDMCRVFSTLMGMKGSPDEHNSNLVMFTMPSQPAHKFSGPVKPFAGKNRITE